MTILIILAAILAMIWVQQSEGNSNNWVLWKNTRKKLHLFAYTLLIKLNNFLNNNMPENANLATILDFGSHSGFIFRTVMSQNWYFFYSCNYSLIFWIWVNNTTHTTPIFGVVHWVPVLSNIKTATGCESNRQLQLWTVFAGTVVNNYQFNGIQGWAGQLCQIRCRAVIYSECLKKSFETHPSVAVLYRNEVSVHSFIFDST